MVLSYVVKKESVKYEVRIYLRAKVGHTRARLRHLSIRWGHVRVGVVSGCVMESRVGECKGYVGAREGQVGQSPTDRDYELSFATKRPVVSRETETRPQREETSKSRKKDGWAVGDPLKNSHFYTQLP